MKDQTAASQLLPFTKLSELFLTLTVSHVMCHLICSDLTGIFIRFSQQARFWNPVFKHILKKYVVLLCYLAVITPY
jgi:hypothetical protein